MSRPRAHAWLFALSLLVSGACEALAAAKTGASREVAESLRDDVERLASDAFEGRGTGEPGIERAERWIAARFEKLGLLPLHGHDEYRVPYASSSRRRREMEGHNVVGRVVGADPTRRGEWIVVGAHHDHLGTTGRGDGIYNGADDNASGVAVLLELAARVSQSPTPPSRTMVFVTFGGEEHGLLGSRSLVESGELDREHVGFMLNLDMVGRNPEDPLMVFGDGTARGLTELAELAAIESELEIELMGSTFDERSDHAPFHQDHIPTLSLFSGFHDDYHGTEDEADKLDYGRMARITDWSARVLRAVDEGFELPAFYFDVAWLGLQAEQVGEVVRIHSLEEDAPGARQGLRSGMEIEIYLDDEPEPASAADLADAPEEARVTLRSHDRSWHFVRPEMAFLGIQPARPRAADRRRYDLGPRRGVWVRAVIAEASAERAGIETDDILTQIEGRAVNNTNLRRVLAQLGAGTKAETTLIRDGEEMKLEVELGARR